jgi:periplasmic divalent cation tolerance protein
MKYAIVITTTDKKSTATKIARALVSKRLAACVQAHPITSTFTWKGRLTTGKEWLLLIKSRASDYKSIEKEIKRVHNYELPELISIPIQNGSRAYLGWIDKATKR